MTVEEITQTLQRVAENQAKHDELHERHTADVAEIVNMIAATIESLSRHDRQLDRLFELVGIQGERQLEHEQRFAENEKRFAVLAEANRRAGERIERLEGSYELLESFVRDSRNESRDYFTQTDIKLAKLAEIQATTNEVLASFIRETNERFAEVAKSQARTDEQIRALAERNGGSGK